MDLQHIVKHPLDIARSMTTRKVVKEFAHRYEFVYFGRITHLHEDHELIRGITVSNAHTDSHYTVGHFRGHDVTLVERRDRIDYPSKPSEEYTWMILQIDLKVGSMPHLFIDANHHDEVFYSHLFTKFGNFQNAAALFVNHDPLFNKSFKLFTPPDMFDDVGQLFTPEVTSMLAYHFRNFDFELFDDRLLVYSSNTIVTMAILKDMLRIAMWLADKLNGPQVTEQE